jgi:hypothetical protein
MVDERSLKYPKINVMNPDDFQRIVDFELARSRKSMFQSIKHDAEIRKRYPSHPSFSPRLLGEICLKSLKSPKFIQIVYDELGLIEFRGESRSDKHFVFGNSMSIQASFRKARSTRIDELHLRILKDLVDNDLFDYAYCCDNDESIKMCLDYSGGGLKAVGLEASKWLQGFFWANFFGPFLCNRIGHEKLMNVPGCRSIETKTGVIVVNQLPSECWFDTQFIANAHAAMDHLGRDLFYEKGKTPAGTLFVPELGSE